jgi:hypothetical protein
MGTNSVSFDFTAPVVMHYASVITPTQFQENGKPKGEPEFNLQAVFDPTHPDANDLKAKLREAMALEWPARNIEEALKEKTVRYPIQTGEALIRRRTEKLRKVGKEYDGAIDNLKGKWVLRAGSRYRPQLSFIERGKIVDLANEMQVKANEQKFFSGAECLLTLSFRAYNAKNSDGIDGVKVFLQNVVVTGKGTKIGGGTPGSERFKGYLGKISHEDPTAGLDDEIPF